MWSPIIPTVTSTDRLIETVASRVDNFKVMVNFILDCVIRWMRIIKVNPYKHTDKMKHISLSGIKECIDHLRGGNRGLFGRIGAVKFRNGRLMIDAPGNLSNQAH